jgi:hypothetical protein
MDKEFEIFMDWVQINVGIPNDGYVWKYNNNNLLGEEI